MPENQTLNELKKVNHALNRAYEEGVQIEVVYSAMKLLQESEENQFSIGDALHHGLKEWDV